MRCPRCQSENMVRIGHLTYCRNCITFGQIRYKQKPPKYKVEFSSDEVDYDLDYDLSVRQKEIAKKTVEAISKKQHVCIQAVCGSGKTELVYPSICHLLNQNKRVGFACPRKDLAIELYERLRSQLKNVNIALVYGGHHDDLYQPLVVLTCHQLHRYWKYFDLLIIDEVDAFPFSGNQLLYEMAIAANRGSFLLLSATAFEDTPLNNFVKFSLDRRYHDHDLPIPHLLFLPDLQSIWFMFHLLKKWVREGALVMIFVPEIKDLDRIAFWLDIYHLNHGKVSSKSKNILSTLESFRKHHFSILLTTTLLERGVTFENVHVIVYRAHHPVFDTSTLIQIAGRVGRKATHPTGNVYFIGKYISKEMRLCRHRLIQKNAPYAGQKNMGYFKTKEI